MDPRVEPNEDPREQPERELRTPERFLALITPIKQGLLGYCRTLCPDRDSAKDLASEAIVIAYQSYGKLKEESALKSYLYTTVKRLARDQWKHEDRQTDITNAVELATSTASPETLADIRLLQEALMQLPEAQRDAIIWHELSGLQLEEIREIQGGSLSAVKMRILRGKEKLAEILGEPTRSGNRTSSIEQLNKLGTFSI
jgi:RNA polymerase sigma-70 factor (ECF subfamily)